MSRVFSSDSNKQRYGPCYSVNSLDIQAFRKGLMFQLPAKGIKSCSLCYMSNGLWPFIYFYLFGVSLAFKGSNYSKYLQ